MNTLIHRSPHRLDTSFVPCVLIGLFWLASISQQAGALALLASYEGVEAFLLPNAHSLVAEFKHAAVPLAVLGFAGVFVLLPLWSWLVCLAMLVSTLGMSIVFSAYSLPMPAFLVSSLLPALFYALALSIALRRRRQLSGNGV